VQGRKELGPEPSALETYPIQSNCWTEYLLYFDTGGFLLSNFASAQVGNRD